MWDWSIELLLLGVEVRKAEEKFETQVKRKVAAAAIVIAWFETNVVEEEETWEFVVVKTRRWMEEQVEGRMSVPLTQAREVLG